MKYAEELPKIVDPDPAQMRRILYSVRIFKRRISFWTACPVFPQIDLCSAVYFCRRQLWPPYQLVPATKDDDIGLEQIAAKHAGMRAHVPTTRGEY